MQFKYPQALWIVFSTISNSNFAFWRNKINSLLRYISLPLWINLAALCPVTAWSQDSVLEIEVVGRKINLVGNAISASEGRISFREIEQRPLLRAGDVLETVPGLVATQHSGSGKANQFYLRGFNLDHGTDFATNLDGMPVNMRSHAHGQGYTCLLYTSPSPRDLSTSRMPSSA